MSKNFLPQNQKEQDETKSNKTPTPKEKRACAARQRTNSCIFKASVLWAEITTECRKSTNKGCFLRELALRNTIGRTALPMRRKGHAAALAYPEKVGLLW